MPILGGSFSSSESSPSPKSSKSPKEDTPDILLCKSSDIFLAINVAQILIRKYALVFLGVLSNSSLRGAPTDSFANFERSTLAYPILDGFPFL